MSIKFQRILLYVFLISLSLFFLIPFYQAFIVASRTAYDLFSYPLTFPTSGDHIDFFDNIVAFLYGGYLPSANQESRMLQYISKFPTGLLWLVNSILYGLLGSLGSILIASLGAYSITKIPYRGTYALFLVSVSMMFFPPQILVIPMYVAMRTVGLYNTFFGMLLVYIGLGVPFATFIMRNHFVIISREILESARMDAAGELRIWLTIVMPLAKPAIAVCFIFVFNFIMHDFLFAAFLLHSPSAIYARPVMPYIYYGTGTTVGTAGSLLVSLPTIVVFIALQKYFIRGLLSGAVKQ